MSEPIDETGVMRRTLERACGGPKDKCRCGAMDFLVHGLCFDCWKSIAAGEGAPTRPEADAVDRSRSYPHAVQSLTPPKP